MKQYIVCACLFFTILLQASENGIKNIIEKLKEQSTLLPLNNKKNVYVGYGQSSLLRNNCARVAQKNIDMVTEKLKAKEKKYNNGLSYINETNPVRIIFGQFEEIFDETKNIKHEPFACIIISDQNEVIASHNLDVHSTIPLTVIDSFIGSEKAFWDWAFNKNYIYAPSIKDIPLPRNLIIDNKKNDLYSFISDDPNIYFAQLIQRKVILDTTNSKEPSVKSSEGALNPVFINIIFEKESEKKEELPFIDIIVADLLKNEGIIYTYNMGFDEHALEPFIEKARRALTKKIDALGESPFTKDDIRCSIRLVPEKTEYTKLGEKIEKYTYIKKQIVNIPVKEEDIKKSIAIEN